MNRNRFVIVTIMAAQFPGLCKAVCQRSPMFDHNTVNVDRNQLIYNHLDDVDVTCVYGATAYDPWGIEGSVICRKDGNWSAPFRCLGQCKAPTVYHVRSDRDFYKHGDIMNWGCDPGFEKNIQLDVVCVDGKWVALPGDFKFFLGDMMTWDLRYHDNERNLFYIPSNFKHVDTCSSVREIALNNFSPSKSLNASQTTLIVNTDGSEDLYCKRMRLGHYFKSLLDLDNGMSFACLPRDIKTELKDSLDNRDDDYRSEVFGDGNDDWTVEERVIDYDDHDDRSAQEERQKTTITIAVAAGSVPVLMLLVLLIVFICSRKASSKSRSAGLLPVTAEAKKPSKPPLIVYIKGSRVRDKLKEIAVSFFCVDKDKTCHDGFPTLM